MTKPLADISKLSFSEISNLIKENITFKFRLVFLALGLIGSICPAWTVTLLMRTFSDVLIDLTKEDEELITCIYTISGKYKR